MKLNILVEYLQIWGFITLFEFKGELHLTKIEYVLKNNIYKHPEVNYLRN